MLQFPQFFAVFDLNENLVVGFFQLQTWMQMSVVSQTSYIEACASK